MMRLQGKKSRRIFISYSWEDQEIARRLQADLQRDGMDVFVDFTRIIPGDFLLDKINAALQWCDTLILLWSRHSAKSFYCNIEWQAAFHLGRRLITCVVDDNATLPPVLCIRAYISFANYKEGYHQLCTALSVTSKIGNLLVFTKSSPHGIYKRINDDPDIYDAISEVNNPDSPIWKGSEIYFDPYGESRVLSNSC